MSTTPSETKTVEPTRSSRKASGFWAVVRYELLWNIRKKKVLAMVIIAFAVTIIPIALSSALSHLAGQTISANPDAVISTASVNTFIMFLLALVTVMNSISGEFESGTIVPLLTKPVSRTIIFLGKVSAALLTLMPVYVLIYIIEMIGVIIIYGPQNDLYLIPLFFLGNLLSTLIWMAIILSIGSLTRSSVFSAIGGFLIYFVFSIVGPIISLFSGQIWILTYLPGSGNAGYLASSATSTVPLTAGSVSTGTDGIANTLVNFALHPSYLVAFVKIGISSSSSPVLSVTSTEPLSYVLLTAVGVAFAYVTAFLLIGWFALRRAQISE